MYNYSYRNALLKIVMREKEMLEQPFIGVNQIGNDIREIKIKFLFCNFLL